MWGENSFGQLGGGISGVVLYPVRASFTSIDNVHLIQMNFDHGAALNEELSLERLEYTVDVPRTVDRIGITAIAWSPTAMVQVNNEAAAKGEQTTQIQLDHGNNQVTIKVTAMGKENAYTINIYRACGKEGGNIPLPIITVSEGGASFAALIHDPDHSYVGSFDDFDTDGIQGRDFVGIRVNSDGAADNNGDFTLLNGKLTGSADKGMVKLQLCSSDGLSLYIRFKTAPAADGEFHVETTPSQSQKREK